MKHNLPRITADFCTIMESLSFEKKPYDITECLATKFNEIGAIQDEFGCIFSFKYVESSEQYIMTGVSENLTRLSWITGGKKPEELLGVQVVDVFEKEISNIIIGLVQRFQSIKNVAAPDSQPRIFQVLPVLCKGAHIRVHDSLICCSMVATSTNNEFILELEEVKDELESNRQNPRILHSGNTMNQIRGADSIDSVISTYIDYVMSLCTCYDRGMAYRFLDDDCGEVIYENIRDPAVVPDSYLHLRFPAEDIPSFVRQLYLKNSIRIICNTHGVNSNVIRADSSPLDLSMSAFRACSNHHIKYLHQMGVTGTLSIAICVNEKLWGLYIFHSYTGPARPSIEERIMFEMIGSITSVKINAFEIESFVKLKSDMNKINRSLQNQEDKRIKTFLQMFGTQCLKLLDAHTVILYYPDETYSIMGDDTILPNEHGIRMLKTLGVENGLVSIDSFTEGLNGIGAGVLLYKHQYAQIIFIRKSKIHDIQWGGVNQNVPNYLEIPRLHPNSSFRIYCEKARKECKHWTESDKEIAEQIVDCFIQCLNSEVLSMCKSELEQSNKECVQIMKAAKENYEFFAHMSHELRTPFHGVISSLQVLQSGDESLDKVERREIIMSALDCGKVMLRTLDDILTIAKNKHNVEVAKLPFPIFKVFSSTRQTMIRMAEVKSIVLQTEIIESKISIDVNELKSKITDDDERALLTEEMVVNDESFMKFVVLGDQTRIGQICNNLTNNAIKFTPAGGKVTMKSTLVSSIDDVYRIWTSHKNEYKDSYVYNDHFVKEVDINTLFFVYIVKDTGCGMTNEDLPSIFEAYKQVSSGVTKTYQGTGLGLHIVRLHMDSMKGMIGVASASHQGTMFLFAIPMQLVDLSSYNSNATTPHLSSKVIHHDMNALRNNKNGIDLEIELLNNDNSTKTENMTECTDTDNETLSDDLALPIFLLVSIQHIFIICILYSKSYIILYYKRLMIAKSI